MSRKTLNFLLFLTLFSLFTASFLSEVQISIPENQEEVQEPHYELSIQDPNVNDSEYKDVTPQPKPHDHHDIPAAEQPWIERFSKSFGYSFLIIFTAQLADKTFVMIIILAMTYGRTQIFLGASLALIIMHTLAVLLGAIVPEIFSQNYIKIGSIIVFSLFGVYLIYKGCRKKNKSVEAKLKKVEKQLQETGNIDANENPLHIDDDKLQQYALISNQNTDLKIQENQDEKNGEKLTSSQSSQSDNPRSQVETNTSSPQVLKLAKTKSEEIIMTPLQLDYNEQALNQPLILKQQNQQVTEQNASIKRQKTYSPLKKGCWKAFLHSAFMKMFLIGLVSQMGDRSQITAVALGAANEVWGVIIGGSFGHILCSLVGVWLGILFMNRISPGKLIIFGGIVCLIFAIDILIFG